MARKMHFMVLGPKPHITAPLWVYFGFKPNDKSLITWRKLSVKFTVKKVPVKSANVINLKQLLQTHHPQQYAELLLDVQKVITLFLFIKV